MPTNTIAYSSQPEQPPTSWKERWAFYGFQFATEAYVVVALTSFIPITLEAMARESGRLYPEMTEPCVQHNTTTTTTSSDVVSPQRCMLAIGNFYIDTASFALYITSLSVLIQALTVVSISAMADYGSYRKKQLLIFSCMGSVSTMLFGIIPWVWIVALMAVIANVSFGASVVCFNAYLPLLVRHDPTILAREEELKEAEEEVSRLMNSTSQEDHQLAAEKEQALIAMRQQLETDKGRLSSETSSRGFAAGYFGGILMLLICLFISYKDKSSLRSLKFGIFLSGLWWAIFAFLAGRWLHSRPGRDLVLETPGTNKRHGALWTASRYVSYSWRRVGTSIIQARKLPNVFAFLIMWIFTSDGYTTITNVALLFAKTSLRMPQAGLILLSLIVPICALLGTLAFPILQRKLGFDQKQMTLLLLVLLFMVPLYGALGLVLSFWPKLETTAEMFALATWFGFLVGSIQSYCRSIYGALVPRGQESQFFGLYAITDKGSSWLGPLVVAAITDATHEIRYAFVFLLVLLSLPPPILRWGVDLEQGRLDAEEAARAEDAEAAAGPQSTDDADAASEHARLLPM
ncbi:Autophagy protein 22 [Actinomortierella ambigua]|nr:Autophagy protein 22 [Actinomortierella ambigua]